MQRSSPPAKVPNPWASSAAGSLVTAIPQTTATAGRASWTMGFTASNMTPIGSGGIPPYMSDVNGAINAVSSIDQWTQAGGPWIYDSTFATNISGYPKGATIQASNGYGLWLSTADTNSNNPDTGGANWAPASLFFGACIASSSSGSLVVPFGVAFIKYRMWGAGGGSSRSNATSGTNAIGSGGGGGGYAEGVLSVSSGGTVTYSIGAGGTADTGSGAGAGGNSSITYGTTTITANGGGAGILGGSGGIGGVTSGSQVGIFGKPGANGYPLGNTGFLAGAGGSAFGSTPYPTAVLGTATTVGIGGTFPGGGAGSGICNGAGAPGANGYIILEY